MAAGDAGALAALYDRHGGSVFNHALRMTADRERAEEAVQSAFVALWHDRGIAAGHEDVAGRILTMVHRRSIELLREPRAMPATVLAGTLARA